MIRLTHQRSTSGYVRFYDQDGVERGYATFFKPLPGKGKPRWVLSVRGIYYSESRGGANTHGGATVDHCDTLAEACLKAATVVQLLQITPVVSLIDNEMEEILEYMKERQDADHDGTRFVPNVEMVHAQQLKALRTLVERLKQ